MRLSYSSAQKILSCEQKYVYEKVMKLEADPDVEPDYLAFRFGKAFHLIHEWCEHELGYFEDKADEYIDKAMVAESLTGNDIACQLYSTVYSSLAMWKGTKLRVIACEREIGSEDVIGFVDFVAICPTSEKWYIGDLKTTSMTTNVSARLFRDPQLCLYAYYKAQIAEMLKLDPNKFAGCLYRETIKPKSVVKPEEKPRAFYKRCTAESHIYRIPVEYLQDTSAVAVHFMSLQRAKELHSNAVPIRNYKNCLAYNRGCEYWSRCYGDTHSNCQRIMQDNTFYLTRGKKNEIEMYIQPLTFEAEAVIDVDNFF